MTKITYGDKELMTDDCLKFLKFIASDLIQMKWVKIILFLTLLVHSGVALITTHFILFKADHKEIIQYLSVYLSFFYPILALCILFIKGTFISAITTEIPLWSINTAEDDIRKNITKRIRSVNILTLLICVSTYAAMSLFLQNLLYDTDIFFALQFFKANFLNHQTALTIIYKMTYPVIAYAVIIQSCQIIYYTQHMTIQMEMFQPYIGNIARVSTQKNRDLLVYDEEYQKQVRQRLVFCVRRSQEMLRCSLLKVKEMKTLIAVFAICAFVAGIGIVSYVVSGMTTPEYYPRMAATCTTGIFVSVGVFWAGQSSESESCQMAETLKRVQWYYFDKNNKVLYLIFLTNLMKKREIKFSENYSVNYQLGLAIARSIYSLLSVMVKMFGNE